MMMMLLLMMMMMIVMTLIYITDAVRRAGWQDLSGCSLLVDGNSFFFWLIDKALGKDYRFWSGGYLR